MKKEINLLLNLLYIWVFFKEILGVGLGVLFEVVIMFNGPMLDL